jgi:hypothetical protein
MSVAAPPRPFIMARPIAMATFLTLVATTLLGITGITIGTGTAEITGMTEPIRDEDRDPHPATTNAARRDHTIETVAMVAAATDGDWSAAMRFVLYVYTFLYKHMLYNDLFLQCGVFCLPKPNPEPNKKTKPLLRARRVGSLRDTFALLHFRGF